MSVELILAAIGAADLCLKYGKELVDACRAYKSASNDIRDKALMIEAIWSRTSMQIEFAQRVLKTHTLPDHHCQIHMDVFETLRFKLETTARKLDSVISHDKDKPVQNVLAKMKYVFLRDVLDAAVSDIERWHRIFDPTWFLVLRVGDSLIDSELDAKRTPLPPSAAPLGVDPGLDLTTARNLRGTLSGGPSVETHVSLPEAGLDWETAQSIPLSTTRTIQRKSSKGGSKIFAVDTIRCDPSLNLAAARSDSESLARKLKHVDPAIFGILSCQGLVKRRDCSTSRLNSIHLVFNLPPPPPHLQPDDFVPTTLRQHLLRPPTSSLTQRLNMARQLASAVSFVHTCEFVHKNIRPETILIFPDASTGKGLGSAYILGFDSFRSVNFQTLRNGDAAWHRNLYRHPQRQGVRAHDSYVMQHDVYSLGVCLLELGLWESFVRYDGKAQTEEEEEVVADKASVTAQGRTEGDKIIEAGEPLPSEALGLLAKDFDAGDDQDLPPSLATKEHLVELARTRLPLRMGDRYAAVVRTCLECLDAGSEDFSGDAAEDLQDEDGVLVGTRFIERVLFKLDEISI